MKFLLIKDHNKHQQNIIDSISEFLWDSGHEVVKIHSNCNIEKREDSDDHDYIIKIADIPGTQQPDQISSDIEQYTFALMVKANKI